MAVEDGVARLIGLTEVSGYDIGAVQYGAPNPDCTASEDKSSAAELMADAVRLYPNPSSQVVHLQVPVSDEQPIRIMVHNSLSREVLRLEKTLQAGEELPSAVAYLKHGMYTVTIQQGNRRTTKKLLISR